MFAKNITLTSLFLSMPMTSQYLYYNLGMSADDDGFVEALMVMRMVNSNEQDLKVLQENGYIYVLPKLVVLILDWKVNNDLRKDRYTRSKYQEIYGLPAKDKSGRYILANDPPWIPVVYQMDTVGVQDVDQMDTQVRLGKVRLGKEREYPRTLFLENKNQILEEVKNICPDKDCDKAMNDFINKTGAKDYGVSNYRQFFINWVTEDKYNQYSKPKVNPKDTASDRALEELANLQVSEESRSKAREEMAKRGYRQTNDTQTT